MQHARLHHNDLFTGQLVGSTRRSRGVNLYAPHLPRDLTPAPRRSDFCGPMSPAVGWLRSVNSSPSEQLCTDRHSHFSSPREHPGQAAPLTMTTHPKFSNLDIEKDVALQVEDVRHRHVLDADVTHAALLHDVTDGKHITARVLADDQWLVNDDRAARLKEQMLGNKLAGYRPVTEEEIAMNKRVNRKMDFVVNDATLAAFFQLFLESPLPNDAC